MTEPKSEARLAFEDFLKREIAPWLKARGFRRRGTLFAKKVGDNYQVISFGADRFNTRFDFRFFVELGVYCGAMREFDEFPPKTDFPRAVVCHWRSVFLNEPLSVGFVLRTRPSAVLGPASAPSEVDEWGHEIRSWLESRALPLLDRNADESVAAEEWRRGPVDGFHETRRLEWLAVELARRGESSEFAATVAKLEEVAAGLREYSTGSPDPFVAKIDEAIAKARRIAGSVAGNGS